MANHSPSQKLLFLSDVHLGGFSNEENRRIEQELIHLIDYCRQNDIKIYILGDLFDYWMEYPDSGHLPEPGADLRERFKSYNRQFGPTLFITGNHDNWTRGYFENLGFEVERNYKILDLDERKVLLLHGDGILNSQGDVRRPLLHRLLRNSRFVRLFQSLFPPRAGLTVMKWFSQINRFIGEIAGTDPEKLNKWAENWLKETETEVIISGHDHVPRKLDFSFGTYINLGNFYTDQTVAIYNNSGFELVLWNDATRQLNNLEPPDPE